jgi:hypothetical protein
MSLQDYYFFCTRCFFADNPLAKSHNWGMHSSRDQFWLEVKFALRHMGGASHRTGH